MRTITWHDDEKVIKMIDQRLLPGKFKILSYDHYQDVADAIRTMVIRGAPAIGVACYRCRCCFWDRNGCI